MVTNISQFYSSVVIDDIYSQLINYPDTGIAFLYADYKDQSNQTLVHILGSFLRQFLNTAKEPILDEVIQKLHDIRDKGKKVETEDILALLKLQLHHLKRMFICIDAIDELDPKVLQQLFNALKGLVSNNTRLFFTGRSHVESEVQKYFQVVEKNKVTISASQQDIQEFVGKQIIDDLNPDAMDEVLAKDIVDAIIQKSQGM